MTYCTLTNAKYACIGLIPSNFCFPFQFVLSNSLSKFHFLVVFLLAIILSVLAADGAFKPHNPFSPVSSPNNIALGQYQGILLLSLLYYICP